MDISSNASEIRIPEFEFTPGMKVIVKPEYAAGTFGDRGSEAMVGRVGVVQEPSALTDYIMVKFRGLNTGNGPGGAYHFLPGELGIAPEEGG